MFWQAFISVCACVSVYAMPHPVPLVVCIDVCEYCKKTQAVRPSIIITTTRMSLLLILYVL
jgi:hypothetical protein